MAFNIFSTLKNNASQAIWGAMSAASNVAGTVSKNIQDFGGDVYHAVQSGKDMAGNIASTVSQNLQNFWGDVYKAQKSVTDYGTQKFDQAQQVGNQVKQNVGDWYTGQINEIKSIPNQIRKANYEAINAWLKSITGKDNAMWSDIAPILKDTLLEKHGEYDKMKVSEAVSKLGQQGLSEDQIKQTLDAINKKDPNFFRGMTYTDKIRAWVAERGSEVAKTYRDFASGKIWFGEAAFRNAGDILGLGGGVVGNTVTQIPWVEYWLQKVGQAVSEIPWVKQGMEAYGEFAQANPRAAQNLEAFTNIGLSAAWSSEGQKLIWEGVKKVSQWAGKVTAPLKPIIKKASDSVSSGLGNIAESVGATATGLQRWTLWTVRKSPELFRQARKWAISRESVVDQTVWAIQKRLDDLSEIGSWYDKIKRGAVVASWDDISGVYLKNAGNVSTRQLTKADRSTLQDLSDYMSEYKGNITDADLLSLRRQIDSVLYDPTTWMPRKLTPQANKIVNDVRADINTMAKDRIKWLAELDAQYAPEVALLKKVKKDIFNSDGTLKDSAISTLANITGKGKEAKLTRLEKILPWIGDRVEAMKAYEDILNASGNKVGTYGRGALAAAWAFTINPSVIGAWVATHPRVVSFVLEKYWLSKKAIAEMVAKKKFSKSDANTISEALKSVGKSKVEKFISTMKPPIIPYNYNEEWQKKK